MAGMVSCTVTGDRQFIGKLRALTPAVRAEGRKTVLKLTYDVAREVKHQYGESGLAVRTGALKGSAQSGGVTDSGAKVSGKVLVGQGLPYARIQEEGGTVVPTHGQFLAIPLDAAKTAAGVVRFAPRDATANGYDRTFIENGIIFGAKWSGGKGKNDFVPLFKLVRQVTIPAHHFVRDAFKTMQPKIEAEIGAAVKRAMAGVM